MVMAGFRAEEYVMVRVMLDTLGAHDVKVLPVLPAMLEGTVAAAAGAPEVDWGAPRPEEWVRGGAWGSQRAVLFSGLSLPTQVGRAAGAGTRQPGAAPDLLRVGAEAAISLSKPRQQRACARGLRPGLRPELKRPPPEPPRSTARRRSSTSWRARACPTCA
jgi:hypothetical protein